MAIQVPPPIKLTVGMACYDDFNGVYFSLQALRLYHAEVMPVTELIIVDNHPDSEHGRMTKGLVESWINGNGVRGRYVPMPEPVGTSAPRDRVFREAAGEVVVCMDSHVLIWPGALSLLLHYFNLLPGQIPRARSWQQDSASLDLLSGPMMMDNLVQATTHFDDSWRAEMWGTWGSDARGANLDGPAFEIPAQGLGLFACRKSAWLGFNGKFRGFGGEEHYIHQKFRKAEMPLSPLPALGPSLRSAGGRDLPPDALE
jgi:hypothetical protein